MADHRMRNDNAVVFIDDSNIFTEGKKFYARELTLYTEEDPCFRIDIGNLRRRLLDGRDGTYGVLYGSEPSPLDTIWAAVREEGMKVKTYMRNVKGKEKEVRISLSLDALEYSLLNQEKKDNTTIIIAGGGRDFCPLVRKLLKYQWSVEVASFSESLAGSIRKIEKKSNLLKIVEIDTFLLTSQPPCYFVNRMWSPRNADKSYRHLPIHLTVAFSFRNEFDLNSNEDKRNLTELANNLTSIVKFPCRYYCITEGELQSKTVLIIFYEKNAPLKFQYETFNTYRTEIHEVCNAIFTRYKFDKFETGVNYYKRKKQTPAVEQHRMLRWFSRDEENEAESFEEEFMESGDENNEAQQDDMASPSMKLDAASEFQQLDSSISESVENSESGGSGYQLVERKKTFSRVTTSHTCEYGFNCRFKTNCTKRHRENEIEYFKFIRDNNMTIRNKYKSLPCSFKFQGRDCRTGNKTISPLCHFYHSQDEAVCYVCRQIGHQQTQECRDKSVKPFLRV